MAPLRIGFFGLPLAALLLQRDGHHLEFAVLSPVPAPGRRRLAQLLPPGALFDLLDDDLGLEQYVAPRIGASNIDLVVSWFHTRKLPAEWLQSAPLGGIGVHPSLLPRHRGPNPFFWAIDAGDACTGVTVHELAAEYDTGDIIAQRSIPVGDRDAWQLARALDRPSLAALREVVGSIATSRTWAAKPQENANATLAPEPRDEFLRVDWSWSTERVLRRIRALSPVPGLALELNGVEMFVTRARACEAFDSALLPGEAYVGERLLMRTGDGAIVVERALMVDAQAPTDDCSDDEAPLIECNGQELAIRLRQSA